MFIKMPDHLVKLVDEFNAELITQHEQYDRACDAGDAALKRHDFDDARRWRRRVEKLEARMSRLIDRREWLERVVEAHHDENCPHCKAQPKDLFELPSTQKPAEHFVN